ncbi:hypothetical protein Patl1_20652 [Pistacia atlantica]|uniref:Uncharacterized protein n=1 Tax=Pistacia atlantica TaxID=434234 RepID=A0ACC1BI76_9ROSI|nr:hypothetical protein Patl1_20652 [Pistacia atlantica]
MKPTYGSESGIENGTYKEVEVEPNANTYCYLRAGCLFLFLIVLSGHWKPFNGKAFEDEVDDLLLLDLGFKLELKEKFS